MIDLHSHILPAVDDGARNLDESIAIARAAVADGVELLAATPHVRADYPTAPETMLRLVDEVGAALGSAGVALDLRPGGELALEALARMSVVDAQRFGLAGNPSYVLVEFPNYGWPLDLQATVLRLRREGVTAVLAHPERNADVQADPQRLRAVVDAGALLQVTAASVNGSLGRRARETSARLVELELAHLVAGDAHAPGARDARMSGVGAAVGDAAVAAWLTHGVPAAIVAGAELPTRPRVSIRRRRRFSLSG